MNKETPIFKSRGNGKLLLSAEYLILKGAKGLSLPLKFGQNLEVFQNETSSIIWESYNTHGLWQKVVFDAKLKIEHTSDEGFANRLLVILKQCLLQSEQTLAELIGKTFITKIDFDTNWGLGSSSTLLYNLASYFKIDAYQLQLKTFNGSGYDVANAGINSPIFYTLNNGIPHIQTIAFEPNFKSSLYFIYSGRKVSSKSAIARFNDKAISPKVINSISQITDLILSTTQLDDFVKLMKLHESIIGELIETEPIQKKYYPDFLGGIKSLGAWGGDFFLVASYEPESYVRKYFNNKGNEIFFRYDQMILNNE